MPSINVDLDYLTHPKTVRLVSLCGNDPCAAFYPIKLWLHVGKYHCENGLLEGYSETEIEGLIGWKGASGELVAIMCRPGIRLLEKTSKGYKIHDWHEHSGHLSVFKRRAKTAAKARWRSNATSIPKRARSTPKEHPPSNAKEVEEQSSYSSLHSEAFQSISKQVLTSSEEGSGEKIHAAAVKKIPFPKPKRKELSRRERLEALEAYEIPEETRTWARLDFKLEIPDDILTEFKDHWRVQKHPRTDWDATFRTRIRQLIGMKILKPGQGMVPVGGDWKQQFLDKEATA